LVLLRAHLAGLPSAAGGPLGAGPPDVTVPPRAVAPSTLPAGAPLSTLPAGALDALDSALPAGALDARQHVFLGAGGASAIADEAALKLREAALAWTESYPAMEYRHGPIALAEPGTLVWIFGTPPDGLADDVRRTGAEVATSTLDPLVDLIRAQRLAV